MAKTWKKDENLKLEDGRRVIASSPCIISASRSTDIPAFYSDWFFHRLKQGYSVWRNPFNGVDSYISYKDTAFIIFWSKNPKPLLPHLHYLNERNIQYYIQFTLNDYANEKLEPGVPSIQQRIDTFKRLVDIGGVGRVIWRFDPLILTDNIDEEVLLDKISRIGDALKGYTEKLVFSFADILAYKKVKTNLEQNHIFYSEWTDPQMKSFARNICSLNQNWHYTLATCGEKIELHEFGIEHNHCVDDDLIIRFAWQNKNLMDFLGVEIHPIPIQPSIFGDAPRIPSSAIIVDEHYYAIKKNNNQDKGQRQYCGCMVSKDIGQYNTCPHQCEYCYANTSKRIALANWAQHRTNPLRDTIIGT